MSFERHSREQKQRMASLNFLESLRKCWCIVVALYSSWVHVSYSFAHVRLALSWCSLLSLPPVRMESVGNVKQETGKTFSQEIAVASKSSASENMVCGAYTKEKRTKSPVVFCLCYLNQHKICQNIKFETFFFASSSRASLAVTILSHHISLNYTQHPKKNWEASYFLSGVVSSSCKTFCHSFIRFWLHCALFGHGEKWCSAKKQSEAFLCSHGEFYWRLKRWCVRVDHKLNCDYIYCLNNWQKTKEREFAILSTSWRSPQRTYGGSNRKFAVSLVDPPAHRVRSVVSMWSECMFHTRTRTNCFTALCRLVLTCYSC